MTRTRWPFALLLLGVVPTSAAAQQPTAVVPGSALLHPERITQAVDTYTIDNYREGTVWRSAKLVRAIDRVTDGGRGMLRLSQTYHTPEGVTVDTTWLDATSLAPIRYFADVYGEIQTFTFSPLEARGTVTPRDSASRPVVHTTTSPFFNAVALELIYAALDFTEGANISFDAYNPPRMAIPISLQYVSREKLPRVGGGTVDAVKVAFGATGTHVWLDARTGALLLNGGSRPGGMAFWKVRSDIDAAALIADSLKAPGAPPTS